MIHDMFSVVTTYLLDHVGCKATLFPFHMRRFLYQISKTSPHPFVNMIHTFQFQYVYVITLNFRVIECLHSFGG